MPRQAARPGPPTLLLGVWGQGETPAENIAAMLDDFIEGAGEVTPKFIVPLEKTMTSDAVSEVTRYAEERKYDYDIVTAKGAGNTKTLKEIAEGAAKTHKVDDNDAISGEIISRLVDAEDSRLLFLWAEDKDGNPDRDDQQVLFAAFDANVVALDLTQGLDVLVDSGPEEGDAPAADAPKPDAAPPAGDAIEIPEYDEAKDWTVRRLRTLAKKVAESEGDDKTDLDAPDKEGLLDFLFPQDDGGAGDEAEKAADEPEGDEAQNLTPAKARATREAVEKEGGTVPKPGRSTNPPIVSPSGDGDSLKDLVQTILEEAAVEIANLIADKIIDRIAERVEKEPEGSSVRQEVAPPRPAGRPRKDGEAPTRRRTARS